MRYAFSVSKSHFVNYLLLLNCTDSFHIARVGFWGLGYCKVRYGTVPGTIPYRTGNVTDIGTVRRYRTARYRAVLYRTVRYGIVPYRTVQYRTVQLQISFALLTGLVARANHLLTFGVYVIFEI